MAIDVEEIRNYIKIDYSDDDKLIGKLLNATLVYLEFALQEAIGKYDTSLYDNFYEYLISTNDKRVKLIDIYILAMIKEMYDCRGLVNADKANEKIKYTMSHILNQLMYS